MRYGTNRLSLVLQKGLYVHCVMVSCDTIACLFEWAIKSLWQTRKFHICQRLSLV